MLRGAPQLFARSRPALIKTEVNTYHVRSCAPREYLQALVARGYELRLRGFAAPRLVLDASDPACGKANCTAVLHRLNRTRTNDDYYLSLPKARHRPLSSFGPPAS